MNIPVVLAKLVKAGISVPSACGVIGNLLCEGCGRSNNAEDNRSQLSDEEYSARVDDGRMTREQFATDSIGYGHAQWTYGPRKRNLYDYMKAHGLSIADENGQIDFLIQEMKREYSALWSWLSTNMSVYAAADRVCREYERPTVNNIEPRAQKGNEIYTQYGMIDINSIDTTTRTPESTNPQVESYWPPRTICEGMSGDDVSVAQALIKVRGWDIPISGVFDSGFKNYVILYQQLNSLAVDGIIGKNTWGALLRR